MRVEIRRPRLHADRLRAYRILVDGQEVGRVRNGGTITIDLPSIAHVLQAKVDWCGSPLLRIEKSGENLCVLEVGFNGSTFRQFMPYLYITFLRNRYLYLTEIDRADELRPDVPY